MIQSSHYIAVFIQNGYLQQDMRRSMEWNSKFMEAEMVLTTLNCGSRYEKLANLIITKGPSNRERLKNLHYSN